MITFKDFTKFVEENIPAYLTGHYKGAKIGNISKLNGVSKEGLIITAEHSMITPIVYLEPFYEKYSSGEVLDEILLEIAKEFRAALHSYKDTITHFASPFDFEKIRNRIIPKLINAAANKELLTNLPHRKIADLAVIYQIYYTMDNGIGSTLEITQQLLDIYHLTIDELHQLAVRNMENIFEMKFIGLMQQLTESFALSTNQDPMKFTEVRNPVDEPIKVLCLSEYSDGASAVLSEKIMNTVIERMGKDFYILPSSLMEVLIIPNDILEVSEMKEIVRTVNIEAVKKEDFLSDEIYLYNTESKEIELADL